MTYIIGAICVWNIPLAAGMAVLLTIILMGKQTLHQFAGKTIQSYELRRWLTFIGFDIDCVAGHAQ